MSTSYDAEVIAGERLELLPLRVAHAPEMAGVLGDPSLHAFVGGAPDTPDAPLLRDRALRDGRPTAYVCRDFVCGLPTTDPVELAHQLRATR